MKLSRKFHAVAKGHLGLQWKAKFLSCAALLSLVGLSQQARGQGSYYPVFPVGAPYGSTYTGTPVLLVNELNFVESILQGNLGPNVTLQIPIPTGKVAPTTAELAAAVLQASQAVLGNTAPPGITLQSLSREVVAYKPADRVFTVDAITGAVVADGSLSVAGKVTKLNDVTVALAQAQPALVDSLIQPILAQARTDASVAQQGIPLLTVSAISAIPRDSVRVGAIIGTAVSNIGQSTVLTSGQKNTLYTDPTTGLIKAVLSGSAVDNNPALIDAALKKFTETNSLNFATLNQVLDSAVLGLSTKNNYTVGALAAGALRSQGGSAALIQTRLNLDLAGTPLLAAQANEFVDGYLQGGSLGTLSTELVGNSRADAVAGGAAIRAVLSTAIIVKQSLVSEQATGGGSLTSAKDVVKAVVAANLDQVVSTVVGSIQGAGDPAPFTPWGDGTLADVAGGAIAAARIESVGAVTQNVIQKSASSVSSLNSATVNSIVNASIFDASASGKSGAFADIVYKAEYVARSTVGASGPLVRQAIQSVNTVSAGAINTRPHYIAVVAALAGATNAQRNEIRDAAFLPATGELYTLAGGPGNVLAATYGANLVRDILGNTARAYTTTLTAFNSANAGTNPGAVPSGPVASNVLAGVYAAVLVNTNESSAGLAAAIKQSGVPAATLTSAAIDAVRGVNATKEPSLKLVGEVAAYAKASALAGTSDPLDYVGRQIIGNPTLVKDIATAWTVVDPNHAHYVSHAVAFNSPASITTSISAIFTYAQITNPTPFAQPTVGNPTGALGSKTYLSGNKGVIIDQPAAAAAITAGLVTGILEAKLTAADEKSKLVSAVSAAVVASIAQDNTYLRGPTNPFNFAGDSSGSSFTDQGGSPATVGANPPSPVPAANAAADNTEGFRQSNGLGGLKTGLGARTVGAAGAITGYIAQTTKAGDTSIVKAGETASTAGSVAFAVLQAASAGQARQYGLEIAQAAAQALRWVAGSSVNAAQAAADIANAIAPSVVGVHDFSGLTLAQTFAKLQTAALFGISEAANGTIGAGALGLNATGLSSGSITVKAAGNNNADFYVHRSATGTPVTDIFNL